MSKKMKLEVLMSVMHQKDFDIAYKTGIKSDLLIVNQCDRNDYKEINVEGHLWRMISTTERGLSKSRNMALKHAKGDICLLCDDDELLVKDYYERIINAYLELPKAVSIAFNVNRINNKMKKRYYKIERIKKAPMYRGYQSGMLTFRLDLVRKNHIMFNEKFGSGSSWGGGEEILFERDIRKKCGVMYEYPIVISTIDYGTESQWLQGFNKKYFYNLGGYYQDLYQNNFIIKFLWMIYNCYKLRKEKELSSIQKMHWMYLGGKGIKKNVTYTEFLDRQESK